MEWKGIKREVGRKIGAAEGVGGGREVGLGRKKRDSRGGAKQRGKGSEERRGLPSTYPYPPGGSDATR